MSCVFKEPSVSYANGNVKWATDSLRVGYNAEDLLWVPVHIAVAELAPSIHGLTFSKLVAKRHGVNVCDSKPVALQSMTMTRDIDIYTDEAHRTVTFIDKDPGSWSQFYLRFAKAREYWDFVQAVAEAKAGAETYHADITEAFEKILRTFPCRPEVEGPIDIGSGN